VYNTPADAVLGEAVTAGQFQITNGQLILNTGGSNRLYAKVAPKTDSSQTKLKVSWSTSQDTLGQFKFSGDTVEWSSSTVTRPQTNVSNYFLFAGDVAVHEAAGCRGDDVYGDVSEIEALRMIADIRAQAWLICADAQGKKEVFINLGAYGYQTPAGCNDHTIHGFTGTTPD